MANAPFLAKVAVGAAVFAIDEARKIPAQAANLPVVATSRLMQLGMRAQQFVADLAVIGDQFFESFQAAEEKPEWATFDDDGGPNLTLIKPE